MAQTFPLTHRLGRILPLLAVVLSAQGASARGDRDTGPLTGPTVRAASREATGPQLEVPGGTVLSVELVDAVSSGKDKPGDGFRLKLQDGIWLKGRVAVPPGATVRGLVTEATPSGRVKGIATLSITLSALELEGKSYELNTDTLSYTGEGHKAQHAGSGIMGALQGALYGMIFGGSDGAMIGAGAGAAAGAVGSLLGGKNDISFAQGANLMFELKSPVRVPEPPPGATPVSAAAAKPEEKPAAKPEEKPAKPEEKSGKPAS